MKVQSRWAVSVLAALAGVTLIAPGSAGLAAAAGGDGAAGAARAVQVTRVAGHDRLGSAQWPSGSGVFYSVAASSANNVWAVGLTGGPGIIWHLNGKSWSQYPISADVYFFGVTVISRKDAWAVGGTNWGDPTRTVAYRWNGKSWTQVRTPTPGGSAFFNGVAATSADNAWAVGSISGGPGDQGYAIPLIEHWNGKKWTRQYFRLPVHTAQFNAVAATSPSNAWAVGGTGTGAGNGALIEHWNGTRWRRLPSHSPHGYGWLSGVSATSPDNVWAAGFANPSTTEDTLIEHWNGKRWSVVPAPNPTGDTNLRGISASSPRNAWAVGYTNPSSCNPMCGTIAMHWNGKAWTVVPTPEPPAYLDALCGVVAISADNAWAVGTTDWGSTIIAHWNGHAWS